MRSNVRKGGMENLLKEGDRVVKVKIIIVNMNMNLNCLIDGT